MSFYPAHHITMGEGGCVLVSDPKLERLVESFRDWGRDCWCEPGAENTCGRRFGWQLGELPYGYDHKYVYSHLGYNLKLTDMQAAVGVAQLDKLPGFIDTRRRNWQRLHDGLRDLEVLEVPRATRGASRAGSGSPLAVRPGAGSNAWTSSPTSSPARSRPASSSAATCCASPPISGSPTGRSARCPRPTSSPSPRSGSAATRH